MSMRMNTGMVDQARSCYPVEGFSPGRETPEGRTRDEGVGREWARDGNGYFVIMEFA